MKKGFIVFLSVLFLGIFIFPGCARKAVKPETAVPEAKKEVEEKEGVREAGKKEDMKAIKPQPGETLIEEPVKSAAPQVKPEKAAAMTQAEKAGIGINDVFFDFDRYSIRDDARTALEQNAKILKEDNGLKVLIEGHADARGTTEYNIALGERRAQAVKSYLVNLGVAAARIQAVSYGEEKPFCLEQTDACREQNRRGHFVVTR